MVIWIHGLRRALRLQSARLKTNKMGVSTYDIISWNLMGNVISLIKMVFILL